MNLFSEQWKKIGSGTHHGINLPLSALHSANSCGIGEFLDLLPLIDWCKKIGFNFIQLLPLNDSGDDPSPYYPLSSCALNPLFISLSVLGYRNGELSRKLDFLQQYNEEKGDSLRAEQSYAHFLSTHPWLENYALFKTLKNQHSKNHWRTWPSDLQHPSAEKRRELTLHYRKEIDFHLLLQYLAHMQLMQVKRHAEKQGIRLMGDVPILICEDSCDVWERPNEFDLTLVAGAPPDVYNRQGQVWGFPLFRWEVMEKTHYVWWRQRLIAASDYYDLFRIDHVLGFFRIWAIPPGHKAKKGHFIPSNPSLWLAHGHTLLKMIAENSPMLPIAEDLGITFKGMRELMQEIGLCGTKVLRWERHWESDKSFIDPKAYTPLSLTTLSTHDSETLTLWWRDLPKEAKAYAAQMKWHYSPQLTREQRLHFLRESHQSGSLFHANLLGEYLALFPELVWEDPEQERINIPGKILPTNWTYRLRPSIEQLTAHEELAKMMKSLVNGKA